MTRVGVYLGSDDDPTENIARLLGDWGEYVDSVNLEAFGSAAVPVQLQDNYSIINTTRRTSFTPFDKILNSYLDGVEYIKNHGPDVVISPWKYHTHAPGIALAGWRTNTPVITRITGDVYNAYKHYNGIEQAGIYLLDNVLGRIPPALSDKMIALGPYERDEVIKRGMAEDDVLLLPPTMPVSKDFAPPKGKSVHKEELGFEPDTPLALYVGRISEAKGIPFLKKVMRLVLEEQDITFILVGEGNESPGLEEEFGENVQLTGQISHERIPSYYKAAEMYIHPSPSEGVPLVILEALACGLPVVARPAGDIPFILHERDLVTDPNQMAKWILHNPEPSSLKNPEYFSEEYQKETLESTLLELANDDG